MNCIRLKRHDEIINLFFMNNIPLVKVIAYRSFSRIWSSNTSVVLVSCELIFHN